MQKKIKNTIILITILALTACGPPEPEKQIEKPAAVLYQEAVDLENSGGSFKKIYSAYEEVERQHPQSEYAKKAISDLVFFAYTNLKYDKAILTAENFLDNNPSHKDTAKIHYILALSYYEQIVDPGRDQSNTAKALDSLNDIIISYPNTDYAINAKYKIDLAKDHLAAKEISVGRFYQSNGDYQAALNRFNTVVNKYSETSHTPEALARLTETYLALGLRDQAYKAAALLGHNHPNNNWYAYAYDLINKNKK